MKIHIPGLSTREHQYSELSKTSEDEDVGAVSPKQNANKFHTAAIVLLILGPTILSIVLAILLIRTKSSNPPTRGWSHSESKIDGFLESMQTLDVQFGADTRYMSLSHEYDELWKEDLRAANARIFHPTLRSEVGSGVGVIAMIHQLHCLASFRKALQDASEGKVIGIDNHDNSHWPHCLYYMRATILCHADITVELPERSANSSKIVVDGQHDVRSCGDSRKVFEFRDQYQHHGPQ